jgi:hypothetical protein
MRLACSRPSATTCLLPRLLGSEYQAQGMVLDGSFGLGLATAPAVAFRVF